MKTHEVKIHENFADDVCLGRKTFEIRYNDRGYQAGDRVKFTVTDDYGSTRAHPINDKAYKITYVLSGWGLKENFVVFGIKEVKQNDV